MNSVFLKGRLGGDPQLFDVGSGKKVAFSIAVNRRFRRRGSDETETETTWIPCEAWDTGAQYIYDNFRKGDAILITGGSIKEDKWVDKESGDKRSKIFVRISSFEKLNFAKSENGDSTENKETTENESSKERVTVPEEGKDIPF